MLHTETHGDETAAGSGAAGLELELK